MNNKYYKTDVEGLVKDPHSGAVLNVDNAKLEAYKKQKATFRMNIENSERISKVERDLNEIKEMLGQLLKRSQ
jgi:hypothetical protein